MSTSTSHLVVTLSCPDKPGIVHAISGAVVDAHGNITESQQFSSDDTGRFFMRLQVETPGSADTLRDALAPVVKTYDMEHAVYEVGRQTKTLILGSTANHCVADLLARQRDGHLAIDVPLVLANHPDLEPTATFYGTPFEWMPVGSADEKQAFEQRVRELVAEHDIELVVLARYMQVISPGLCRELAGRIVNIHHSFLPGFKGAQPYRQAHERGVKLIGATAHFVTEDLDEGPIIEQNVVRVDHSQSVSELVRVGQDEESRTLTRAVEWFAEHRILMDGIRTIIFR